MSKKSIFALLGTLFLVGGGFFVWKIIDTASKPPPLPTRTPSGDISSPSNSGIGPATAVKLGKISPTAEIVYHQDGHIYVMDQNGQNIVQLTFGSPLQYEHIAVSFDRNYVVATEHLDRGSLLWLYNLKQGTQAQLAPGLFQAVGVGGVDWDSNGFIYFSAAKSGEAGNIYKIKFDGTGLTKLTNLTDEGAADVSVSEDGRLIAYQQGKLISKELESQPKGRGEKGIIGQGAVWGEGAIWMANADGSNSRLVKKAARLGAPGKGGVTDPELSPDNKRVVFNEENVEVPPNFPNDPGAGVAHDIWMANLDGTELKRITQPGPISIMPDWKDNLIVYMEMSEKDQYMGASIVNADGENQAPRRIKPGANSPKWIPLLSAVSVQTTKKVSSANITKYLTFQIFTNAPSPETPAGPSPSEVQSGNPHALSGPPPKEAIQKMVRGIKAKIGTTGDTRRKLGFVAGPLAFDYTDAQNVRLIRDVFSIAAEENVAVGLHLDDSMFWQKRGDLWKNSQNVEWLNWNKTPNTGRRIDWAETPVKFPPQMCFNSPDIQKEIRRFAGVIGREVQQQVDHLKAEGREELFAGVIAGWETNIARDFDTGKYLGYCALTNKGFSAGNPPKDIDREREKIVKEFIELWAKALTDAGVPKDKIYSHTAFVSQKNYEELIKRNMLSGTYSLANQFAPPSVSFSPYFRPGFSTYPQPGLLDQISEELSQNNNPSWVSSEGTAIGTDMRTYLDGLFNHGATLVNIFAWGVGPYVPENPYRYATERPEAIAAYQKFLRGETLKE